MGSPLRRDGVSKAITAALVAVAGWREDIQRVRPL
jgi:hypothetical protein